MTNRLSSYSEYIVPEGFTRDCQKRRLTDSVYVNVSNVLQETYRSLCPQAHFGEELTGVELALLKILFTHVRSNGESYIPLSQWKFIIKEVVRAHGGKRALRVADPLYFYELTREDRSRTFGRNLRAAVIARLESGFGHD